MRITAETHPEALKRYAHVRPAGGPPSRLCSIRLSDSKHVCTLAKGHRGPHVSHRGVLKRVAAVWDEGVGGSRTSGRTAPPPAVKQRRPGDLSKRPVGLRERPSGGPLESVWKLIVRLFSSPEELALLVFFLAFVGFALHWLVLILVG